MADIKNNLRGAAAPLPTDDAASGYSRGSYWEFGGRFFVCRDATAGAAKWAEIGQRQAWQSNQYIPPDNCVDFADVQPSSGLDRFCLFPFPIDRPIAGVAVTLVTPGSAGAIASFGIYPSDPLTGYPNGQARIASAGTIALDTSAGFKQGTFGGQPLDLFGLFWVSVHLKGASGVSTMPVVKGMLKSNGRHIHRNDGSEFVAGAFHKCLQSNDTYTASPPAICPSVLAAAPSHDVPMPVLRAA